MSVALWAHRNVTHESTGEKPSFLLLGIDCHTPALLPSNELEVTEVSDYQEKVILSLSTARRLAAESITTAQAWYKHSYDQTARQANYKRGDWVLVHFPQDERRKGRKLSRPWHGPYRVVDRTDPNLTVVKIYSPQDGEIHVPCPPELPAGFYGYGDRRARQVDH